MILGVQDPRAGPSFGDEEGGVLLYFDGSRRLTGRGSKARIFTE